MKTFDHQKTNIKKVGSAQGNHRCRCGRQFECAAETKDGRLLYYWCPDCDVVRR